MREKIIGIDVGATKIHLGLVQGSAVIKEIKFPTSASASKEEILLAMIQKIEEVNDSDVAGIGIGVPGLVDEKKGIVYDLSNIPSWKEVHLKERLEAHFKKPVMITNDANVFAMGEKIFGKGGPFGNMVGVTLGSGFGTGIIINHELYSGTLSSAGELATIPYLDKTIEDYCSGKFFLENHGIKGDEIFKRASQGENGALEIFDEFGTHLGNALNIIMKVLSPEAIFLGGSVSRSYEFFEGSLEKTLNGYPFEKVRKQLVVKPSETSNISILGAAALIISGKGTT